MSAPVIALALPPPALGPAPIPPGCDPEALLIQAHRLGAFPAVYRNLLTIRPDAARAIQPCWEERFRNNLARNLQLRHEESFVVRSLRQAGIACHPIKGVSLVELLYPDLSWRSIADIDLLLPPSQVEPAYRALLALGLADVGDPWSARGLAGQLTQPDHCFPEIVLHTPRGVIVELHWDWPGLRFPAASSALEPEPFLLYLSRHAGKHLWSSLQHVVDLELYLRRFSRDLDWDAFWRLASARGWDRVCAAGFDLCARLFPWTGRPSNRPGGRALAGLAGSLLIAETQPWWWKHPALRLLRALTWRQRWGRVWRWLAPPPWEWNLPGARSTLGVWFGRYRRLALQGLARLAPLPAWRRRLGRAASVEWTLVIRIFCLLTLMRVGLALVPFPHLQRWAARLATFPGVAASRAELEHLRWLVDGVAKRHPVPMRCLARSLVLLRLLSRRGFPAELKMGVRAGDGGRIHAHAWVEYAGEPVNDPHGVVPDYAAILPR